MIKSCLKYSIVSTLALTVFIHSCGTKKVSGRTGKARGNVTMPDGTSVPMTATRGGYSAALDPNSTTPQIMSISQGTLAGVSVAFPVGALSIPVTISITPGTALNGSAMMSTLGMNNTVSSSGTPIEISPSASIDLKNPMVLSLPMPRGAGLTDTAVNRQKLAVLYRVKVAEGSDTGSFTGIVPAKELGIDGDKVLFETKYFGWFSVVEMEQPVTEAIKTKAVYADQLSARFFATLAELPACTTADLYRIAYVGDESAMYYCGESGSWVIIEENSQIPSTAQPAMLVKDNGDEIGRLISATYDSWRFIVEDSQGTERLVTLKIDSADPSVGITTTDIDSSSATSLYYTGAGCTGDIYSSYIPSYGTKWINSPLFVNGIWRERPTSSVSSQSYASYYMTSTCTDSANTLTTAYPLTPFAAGITMPIPFTGAWHIE